MIVAVREIAEQVRGVTYSKGEAIPGPQVGYVPLLRANNITDEGLSFSDLTYVPLSRVALRQRLQEGDVVIAASSGSLDVVGKAAEVQGRFEGSFGAFCKVLRPDQKAVDPRYFSHFFRTADYRRKVSSLAAGLNINNLKNEHLDDLRVPLPSLDEQRRIAAILDKADALRRKRRRALDLLDSLKQSIFLEMFGDPVMNPKGFQKVPVGEIVRLKSGNGLTAKEMVTRGKYPVYGGNGVNGYHDKYMFAEPKLVLGRVGVYCGAVHLTESKCWVTDNALYASEIKRPISLVYLKAALAIADLNQYAGRAAQPLISGSRIYPVEILLPPAREQQAFESAVLKTGNVAERLQAKGRLDNSLFASLQSRAFTGQL